MRYRALCSTGIEVSEIGLGGEYLEGKPYSAVEETISAALAGGINIIDIFMSEPNVRTNIGKAIAGRRDKVLLQGHLRSVWKNGQYGRTLDLAETKAAFEDLLTRLNTDYIDIGMLHMVDNLADYEAVFEGEIYRYALELKERGVIRCIGMSSHNPYIAKKAVDAGLIDTLLFSLNAAYDLLDDEGTAGPPTLEENTFAAAAIEGMSKIRSALYRACELHGIGITVMKGLAAGVLLDEKRSPFGAAMTVPQCINYALTRPGVASIVLGLQTKQEVASALRYERCTNTQRDYSKILAFTPKFTLKGHCMYCNHCLPCASRIDVAQVNKLLDLALAAGGPTPTLREHYNSLDNTANKCVACGTCEKRCPFDVPIVNKMQQALELFGK